MEESSSHGTSSVHWTVKPDGEVHIKAAMEGPASAKPITVIQALQNTVKRFPDRVALKVQRGDWQTLTWTEYYQQIKSAAKSFIKVGLKPSHAVGILGFNSPEWFIADLGAIMAGGFATGIYTTNSADSCLYIAQHSEANVIVVENDAQLDKILSIKDELPELKAIVQYIGEVEPSKRADNIYSWTQFMALGAEVPDYELQWRLKEQRPGKCCTLIYTSGTTGKPKAVMCSHDNLTWTARVTVRLFELTEADDMVSYLPLSHVAAQMLDIHAPLITGHTTHFARPDALKGPVTLKETLLHVRPTVFMGVPRVWEKFAEKVQSVGRSSSTFTQKVGSWAKSVGLYGNLALQQGESKPWGFWLANHLVFSKIRAKMGLDKCRVMCTAAAPISNETLKYFLSLDLKLLEVYGMSECTGPQTVSIPDKFRTGSCGFSLPGTELRIMNKDKDGNGEICMRGRHIMMGYMKNEQKTRESIDDEGFLHSGDIGCEDSQGFVTITGRIKELLITAGGENVAPVAIEEVMKEECPIISNCMVIGDKRKFLSMLVTLRCVPDNNGEPTDELSDVTLRVLQGELNSTARTVSEAIGDPKIKEYIQAAVKRGNGRAISRAQYIQKWEYLPIDFSIVGGELGPTLKVRRPVVMTKYCDLIQKFYEETTSKL